MISFLTLIFKVKKYVWRAYLIVYNDCISYLIEIFFLFSRWSLFFRDLSCSFGFRLNNIEFNCLMMLFGYLEWAREVNYYLNMIFLNWWLQNINEYLFFRRRGNIIILLKYLYIRWCFLKIYKMNILGEKGWGGLYFWI